MPHYSLLSHHGVLILQNKGNNVIDFHIMRQDKIYKYYSVKGDIEHLKSEKEEGKKDKGDDWKDILLHAGNFFVIMKPSYRRNFNSNFISCSQSNLYHNLFDKKSI